MGLDAIVRSAVAVANTVTGSLQVTVHHKAWTSRALDGAPTFNVGGPPIKRSGLLEYKQSNRFSALLGQTVDFSVKVTILGPIKANGAAGRHEPIDARDRFLLPAGADRAVVDVEGFLDPTTGRPYMYEIFLA